MLVCFDCLDGLLCMNSRHSCYHNGLKLGMLEHLIVIVVKLHTEWSKVLIEPCDLEFGLSRAISSDQLCSRSFCWKD